MKKLLTLSLILFCISTIYAGYRGDGLGPHEMLRRLNANDFGIDNLGVTDASNIYNVPFTSGAPKQFIAYISETGGVSKGQPVYISGKTGTRIRVSLADNTISGKDYCDGLAFNDYANNAEAIIIQTGYIENLDTSDWTENFHLYLRSGIINDVEPSSGTHQHLAHCVDNNATTGVIYVHVEEVNQHITGQYGKDIEVILPLGGGRYIVKDSQGNEIVIMTSSSMTFADTYSMIANAFDIATKQITVTDFTDEGINVAIDALGSDGGMVYMPEGTYTINGTITIDYNNTSLVGAGNGTYLDASSWTDDKTVINLNGKDNLYFANFQLEAEHNGGYDEYLIVDNGAVLNSIFENLYLHHCYVDFIKLTNVGSNNNMITNCKMTNGDTGAGVIIFGNYNVITENIFEDFTTAWGIYVAGDRNIVSNNTLNNIYDGLQVVSDANYNVITGNTIYNNPTYGIRLHTAYWNTISNNIIDGNNKYTGDGIDLNTNTDYNTVIGNTVYDCGNGISESATSDHNLFIYNNVRDNTNDYVLNGTSSTYVTVTNGNVTFGKDIISGATVYGEVGNFDEIFTSTIRSKSPLILQTERVDIAGGALTVQNSGTEKASNYVRVTHDALAFAISTGPHLTAPSKDPAAADYSVAITSTGKVYPKSIVWPDGSVQISSPPAAEISVGFTTHQFQISGEMVDCDFISTSVPTHVVNAPTDIIITGVKIYTTFASTCASVRGELRISTGTNTLDPIVWILVTAVELSTATCESAYITVTVDADEDTKVGWFITFVSEIGGEPPVGVGGDVRYHSKEQE